MAPSQYTRIVLNERPKGNIDSNTFRKEVVPFDLAPKAHILVKIIYLSLDPAMRGWINDTRSYMAPVQIGETMRAGGLGVVVKVGEGSKFKEGDWVYGMTGGFSCFDFRFVVCVFEELTLLRIGWTDWGVYPDKGMQAIK